MSATHCEVLNKNLTNLIKTFTKIFDASDLEAIVLFASLKMSQNLKGCFEIICRKDVKSYSKQSEALISLWEHAMPN